MAMFAERPIVEKQCGFDSRSPLLYGIKRGDGTRLPFGRRPDAQENPPNGTVGVKHITGDMRTHDN